MCEFCRKDEEEKEEKEEVEEEAPVEEEAEVEKETRTLKRKDIGNYFTRSDFEEISRFLRLFEIIRNGPIEAATFLTVSNDKGKTGEGEDFEDLDAKGESLRMEIENSDIANHEFVQQEAEEAVI